MENNLEQALWEKIHSYQKMAEMYRSIADELILTLAQNTNVEYKLEDLQALNVMEEKNNGRN